MKPEHHITALVLAGGKSSRMGMEKGFVRFHEKKLIDHVLDNVRSVVNEVIIVSNNNIYHQYGYPVRNDIYKDCGPLGGIYAGLMYSKSDWNLVLGCDMPFAGPEFLKYLISHISSAETI